MPQTAIGPRNISNYNILGCHGFYFACLLGRPGAPNNMDSHAFPNIGRCEIVKKQLVLKATQASAFRFVLNHGRANRRRQLRNCSQETPKLCFSQLTEHHLNPNPE